MEKVYIVVGGCVGDRSIYYVSSTSEQSEKWIDRQRKSDKEFDVMEYSIEEWDVNTEEQDNEEQIHKTICSWFGNEYEYIETADSEEDIIAVINELLGSENELQIKRAGGSSLTLHEVKNNPLWCVLESKSISKINPRHKFTLGKRVVANE